MLCLSHSPKNVFPESDLHSQFSTLELKGFVYAQILTNPICVYSLAEGMPCIFLRFVDINWRNTHNVGIYTMKFNKWHTLPNMHIWYFTIVNCIHIRHNSKNLAYMHCFLLLLCSSGLCTPLSGVKIPYKHVHGGEKLCRRVLFILLIHIFNSYIFIHLFPFICWGRCMFTNSMIPYLFFKKAW